MLIGEDILAFIALGDGGGESLGMGRAISILGVLDRLGGVDRSAILGDHRADALGVDPDTSALILTQRVSYRGAVVLFAKSVVLSEAGTISLQQSA